MNAPISFEAEPSRYRHLRLETEGGRARIILKVDENGGLRPGYLLKLNSYDLAVDIELADAINRLRFEHPEVSVVTLTSATEGTFCAGANIFMLATSDHSFKVNFCKFTNETRLAMEDASANSGQRYIAALNGSLPEIPYLGVLPGTGGLTRLVDKRRVRRDLADVFVTLAEGVRGEKAVQWRLADSTFPPSQFAEAVAKRVESLVDVERISRAGIKLNALSPAESENEIRYRHLTLKLDQARRLAEFFIEGPLEVSDISENGAALGADWYPLRLFREIDDALLRLRFNYPEIGLVLMRAHGDLGRVMALDRQLRDRNRDWFVRETMLLLKRVLKRLDLTAKSIFALVDEGPSFEGSCFGGFMLELALAADRIYMKSRDGVQIATSPLNGGALPMSNGLSRLETRFLHRPEHARKLAAENYFDPDAALEAGLVTGAPDELDWEEEIRLAADERLSLSPDALTGMEASLRFAGPETMETKIFARLSAWQNWVFQRPNAVGERGALKLYGRPESPQFDWKRT